MKQLACAVACAAAVAASGSAASAGQPSLTVVPPTVTASGQVPFGPTSRYQNAFVQIDLSKGPGQKLVFGDIAHLFRALTFSIEYGPNWARFTGTGVAGGKIVPFTALAIHDPDSFFISWNHSARRGGLLANGSVTVAPRP